MQLENSFTVPVPIDEAWRVLLDIERIAPACRVRRSTPSTATTSPAG
ncbi:hypothetical protein [Blastococcus brunescens]|uniref:Carbon monoxide dehydrogenase subunit G n=1 Tax=Blastococcus brunescens TaxID=1564165 RepID=A0ABZ1B002_9ACTN|nr:hypothetical protein [Blastococcus sp. BMG 8361]WRL63516.1 hypothetical protein U6N30_28025 [Blastococcus sp. BMG 8361]